MRNLCSWFFVLIGTLALGGWAQEDSVKVLDDDGASIDSSIIVEEKNEAKESVSDREEVVPTADRDGNGVEPDEENVKHGGLTTVKHSGSMEALGFDPERTRRVRESHDLDAVREEIDRLRDQADRLERLAERLEDDAEELEDHADDLLERAGGLESKKKLIEVLEEVPDSLMAPEELRLGEAAKGLSDKQEVMIERLRENADALIRKAKAMSVKVRVMEEHADRNEEEADDLEELAEDLEELRDTVPFQVVHPFQLSFEHRLTSVPPTADEEVHLLTVGGLGLSYYVTPRFRAGVEDLAFLLRGTVHGERYAVSFAPVVDASVFFIRRVQVSGGIGALLQIQGGDGPETKSAVAPFAVFKSLAWAGKRFSVGPSLRLSYLAVGNLYSTAIPSDRANVLPESAVWIDFGVSLNVHL